MTLQNVVIVVLALGWVALIARQVVRAHRRERTLLGRYRCDGPEDVR